MRGGGHFSGRLTAPLCIAGGIAKQILARRGIYVGAHLASVGVESDSAFPLHPSAALFDEVASKPFPGLVGQAGERMEGRILEVPEVQLGYAATALGWKVATPVFDGANEKDIRETLKLAGLREDGKSVTASHRAGGILGGITTGMPITLRVALKPTPSISLAQRTVSLSAMENAELVIRGRHDPCIAHRAVPVVEAVTATVLLDLLLEGNHGTF